MLAEKSHFMSASFIGELERFRYFLFGLSGSRMMLTSPQFAYVEPHNCRSKTALINFIILFEIEFE